MEFVIPGEFGAVYPGIGLKGSVPKLSNAVEDRPTSNFYCTDLGYAGAPLLGDPPVVSRSTTIQKVHSASDRSREDVVSLAESGPSC
jgi:hypothetical protein